MAPPGYDIRLLHCDVPCVLCRHHPDKDPDTQLNSHGPFKHPVQLGTHLRSPRIPCIGHHRSCHRIQPCGTCIPDILRAIYKIQLRQKEIRTGQTCQIRPDRTQIHDAGMLMDHDSAHRVDLHLVHILPIYRASGRAFSCSLEYRQRCIRTALDGTCSILIDMQHPGQQHHRRRKRGQGNVTGQTHPQTLIRNRDQHRIAVLHIPESSHQCLYRHPATHPCHYSIDGSDVQFVPSHSRSNGPLQRGFRNRQHQDSIPSRTRRPRHLHSLLHDRGRHPQGRCRNMLERRTCLRRCPPGSLPYLSP